MAGITEAKVSGGEAEAVRRLREVKDDLEHKRLTPVQADAKLEEVRKAFGWGTARGASTHERLDHYLSRFDLSNFEAKKQRGQVSLGDEGGALAGARALSRFDGKNWGASPPPPPSPARVQFDAMLASKEPQIDMQQLRAMQQASLHVVDRLFSNKFGTDNELRGRVKERLPGFEGAHGNDALQASLFGGRDKTEQQRAALGFLLQTFRGTDGRDRALRAAVLGKIKAVGTLADFPAILRCARSGIGNNARSLDAITGILSREPTPKDASGRALVLAGQAELILAGRNPQVAPRDLKALQAVALHAVTRLFTNEYGDDGPLREQVEQRLGQFPLDARAQSLENSLLGTRTPPQQQFAALKFILRTFRGGGPDVALREVVIDKLVRLGEPRLPENPVALVLHTSDMGRVPGEIAKYLGALLRVDPSQLQVNWLAGGFSGDFLFDVWSHGKSIGVLKVFKSAEGSGTQARLGQVLIENGVRTPENRGMSTAEVDGRPASTMLMERVSGTTISQESAIPEGPERTQAKERLKGMAREDARFLADMQAKLASGEPLSDERKQAFMDYVLTKLQSLQSREDLRRALPEAQLRAIWARLERTVFPAYKSARVPATMSHGDFWSANAISDEDGVSVIDLDRLAHSMDAKGKAIDGPGRDTGYFAATIRSGFGLSDHLTEGDRAEIERAFLDEYRAVSPFPSAAIEADYRLARTLAELNVASWGSRGRDWAGGALRRLCTLLDVPDPEQAESLISARTSATNWQRMGSPFALGEGIGQQVSKGGASEGIAIANPRLGAAFVVKDDLALLFRDKNRFPELGGKAPYQVLGLPVED